MKIKDLAPSIKERHYGNYLLHNFEMRRKHTFLLSSPTSIQLEPTNRCNLKCVICGQSHWDETRNILGDMTLETFRATVPFLIRANEVVIGGYGEPLLGENLWPIIENCKRSRCWVRLITNGTLLAKETCQGLIANQVNRVIVSIDAATSQTFAKIRQTEVEDVLENIRLLQKMKRASSSPEPEITLNFVAMRDNISELPLLIDLAAKMDIEGIDVWHQMIYSKDQIGQSLFLYKDMARRYFEISKQRAEERGLWLNLPSLDEINKFCIQPFDRLFVRWNGDVMRCCSAIFVNDRYNFPLGNLKDSSLKSIWNCRRIREYRKAAWNGSQLPENCRNCAFRHDTLESHIRLL